MTNIILPLEINHFKPLQAFGPCGHNWFIHENHLTPYFS